MYFVRIISKKNRYHLEIRDIIFVSVQLYFEFILFVCDIRTLFLPIFVSIGFFPPYGTVFV